MNFFEQLKLAFTSISVNKMRSFLTMLGIIIGISSVITITTIGNSLKQTLASTMNDLGGANRIYGYVEPFYPDDDEDWDTWVYPDMGDDDYITDEDIADYKAAFPDEIKSVIVQNYLASGAIFKEGGRSANVDVQGTSGGYLDITGLDILRGRDLTSDDYSQKRHTAIVSDLFVKYALSPDEDPIGKEITVSLPDGGAYSLVIAGVYKYDKRILGNGENGKSEKELSTPIYIPASTSNALSDTPSAGYDNIQIVANNGVDATTFSAETADYFNSTVYKDNKDFNFTCQDLASELSTINKVLDVITIAISVIAAISLVVGGVGVMNIMLVSIMERTKEIGIRKALGAKNSNIKAQFLIEAVTICLIGGIIGIIIGITNGLLIGMLVKTIGTSLASDYMSLLTITVRPSITAIVIAVGFSMLTGVIFGSYPASRAAKLSPIDALRYE